MNCIGGVMVNVLASSSVDGGFEPRSGKSKDYKIDICCFPVKDAALRRKTKTVHLFFDNRFLKNTSLEGVST
jgi:hypothetical protein